MTSKRNANSPLNLSDTNINDKHSRLIELNFLALLRLGRHSGKKFLNPTFKHLHLSLFLKQHLPITPHSLNNVLIKEKLIRVLTL